MEQTLLIGEGYREKLEHPLNKLGIKTIWLQANPDVDRRLAYHADLSAFCHEKKLIISRKIYSGKLVKQLTNLNLADVIMAESVQSNLYPNDVNLCACSVGRRIFHNTRYTDPAIKRNYEGKIEHVNQGYARCSACVVNDNAIITSDRGIAAAAMKNEIDVLEIGHGEIILDGFDYGFIGGATIAFNDMILFTGSLNNHPDGASMSEFIVKHGKKPVFLTDGPLFDIGGAVAI